MQCDVTRCVICISNNVEYLNKEESKKNSTKEYRPKFRIKPIKPVFTSEFLRAKRLFSFDQALFTTWLQSKAQGQRKKVASREYIR